MVYVCVVILIWNNRTAIKVNQRCNIPLILRWEFNYIALCYWLFNPLIICICRVVCPVCFQISFFWPSRLSNIFVIVNFVFYCAYFIKDIYNIIYDFNVVSNKWFCVWYSCFWWIIKVKFIFITTWFWYSDVWKKIKEFKSN